MTRKPDQSQWRFYVACASCNYVGYSVAMDDAGTAEFSVPEKCPACEAKELQRKPGRFTIWWEVLRARRKLRNATLEIWEP